MVAVGLLKQLSTKFAVEAALNAGAKIMGTFSYGLSDEDIKLLACLDPDIIILTGGLDGNDDR
jgi:hypothetical protein